MKLVYFAFLLISSWLCGCGDERGAGLDTPHAGTRAGRLPTEKSVSIEATPKLRQEPGYSIMELSADGRQFEVLFRPESTPWFAYVQTKERLRFVLWEQKEALGHYDDGKEVYFITLQVAEIWDDQRKVFDAAECPLHHVSMERRALPINYGLPSAVFLGAFQTFSGGPGFVVGGCVAGPQKELFGYRCPECARLYQLWSEEQKRKTEMAAE